MGLDLKDIDGEILDELTGGRNVPSNLADELDVTRQYIQQRLQLLEAADHVENVGRGVYELVDDPRIKRGVLRFEGLKKSGHLSVPVSVERISVREGEQLPFGVGVLDSGSSDNLFLKEQRDAIQAGDHDPILHYGGDEYRIPHTALHFGQSQHSEKPWRVVEIELPWETADANEAAKLKTEIETLKASREEIVDERDELRERVEQLEERRRGDAIDVDRVQTALDDVEAAAERGDAAALQKALRRAREVLEE